MKHDYPDIRSLTVKEPIWYDINGVPRFAPHSPKLCPNIYVSKVVLLGIQCQMCRQKFKVQIHHDLLVDYNGVLLEESVRDKTIHYGDPPTHGGCAGNTMNCEDLRVLEFWVYDNSVWKRNTSLEIDLDNWDDCVNT